MRRTVKVEFSPRPRRPITTPEKIWMRSLSPSTTLVWTRTESPTSNLGESFRNCSDSILSNNAWLINSQFLAFTFRLQQIRPALRRAQSRLLSTPLRDFGVISRKQHVGHRHAAEFRRTRIVRIFQQTVAERFIRRALLVAQNSGQQ